MSGHTKGPYTVTDVQMQIRLRDGSLLWVPGKLHDELLLDRAIRTEMLEALRAVLDMFESRPDMLALVGVQEGLVIAQIVSARAKAEGRET